MPNTTREGVDSSYVGFHWCLALLAEYTARVSQVNPIYCRENRSAQATQSSLCVAMKLTMTGTIVQEGYVLGQLASTTHKERS